MIARHLLVAASAALILGSRGVAAQQAASRPFSFGMAVNSMGIDPAKAGSVQIGNKSWGMQIDAGYVAKRWLYLGIDVGPQALSDKAQFTQATTGGTLSSTATLTYFSAMAGPRTPAVQLLPGVPAMSLGLYGGTSTTVTKRSIDNCTDCRVDDLAIPGGTFVQPTLLMGGSRLRVRLTHRQYLNADGIRNITSAGAEFGQ